MIKALKQFDLKTKCVGVVSLNQLKLKFIDPPLKRKLSIHEDIELIDWCV